MKNLTKKQKALSFLMFQMFFASALNNGRNDANIELDAANAAIVVIAGNEVADVMLHVLEKVDDAIMALAQPVSDALPDILPGRAINSLPANAQDEEVCNCMEKALKEVRRLIEDSCRAIYKFGKDFKTSAARFY